MKKKKKFRQRWTNKYTCRSSNLFVCSFRDYSIISCALNCSIQVVATINRSVLSLRLSHDAVIIAANSLFFAIDTWARLIKYRMNWVLWQHLHLNGAWNRRNKLYQKVMMILPFLRWKFSFDRIPPSIGRWHILYLTHLDANKRRRNSQNAIYIIVFAMAFLKIWCFNSKFDSFVMQLYVLFSRRFHSICKGHFWRCEWCEWLASKNFATGMYIKWILLFRAKTHFNSYSCSIQFFWVRGVRIHNSLKFGGTFKISPIKHKFNICLLTW